MNNTHITTWALAAACALLSQGVSAQSNAGFQISLDRSGVSQPLSQSDFYADSGVVTTQAEMSRIDHEPTILSHQILDDERHSEPYTDADGNLVVLQKSLIKMQTVTDVTVGTTFTGDAHWVDWDHQYFNDQSPSGTVTGVTITPETSLNVASYYLHVSLAGHTAGTFSGELPPVSLVLPEGSAAAPMGEVWFDDVGDWSYSLTLHSENYPQLPLSLTLNVQPGGYLYSVYAEMNSMSVPTLQYQSIRTESYINYEQVPWNPAAVPEPSTWALSALGLGWVLTRARKARVLAA